METNKDILTFWVLKQKYAQYLQRTKVMHRKSKIEFDWTIKTETESFIGLW